MQTKNSEQFWNGLFQKSK